MRDQGLGSNSYLDEAVALEALPPILKYIAAIIILVCEFISSIKSI